MNPLLFLPVMIVSFATSLGMTPLARAIALRIGVVDKPNQRKIHQDHKPLMGGLAVVVAVSLSLLLFSTDSSLREILLILLGVVLLAVTGLLDDRFDLSAKLRLGVQVLAACILILAGIRIQLINFPLINEIITIVWVVALCNAVNFLDNMDGLSSGLTAIAATFFMLIGLTEGLPLVSMLAGALMGATLGFWIYNFNPSSIFIGDMGTLVMGYILATLGIKLEFGSQPLSITWMVPLFVLALPIFDIVLVVFTRISEGRSPGQAGKDHTSHRLMSLGLSQRKTTIILYLFCILNGVIAFFISTIPANNALLLGMIGLASLAVLFVVMIGLRKRYQLSTQ